MKSNFDIRDKANLELEYELFKLQWMINHGHTLSELMQNLDQYNVERIEEFYESSDDFDQLNLDSSVVFKEWEQESGFIGGEIYPCFEEWLENDRVKSEE